MIYFRPIINDGQAVSLRIAAYNASSEIGSCALSVDSYDCRLSDFIIGSDEPLLAEGIIRSALNYAANRGAYIAHCDDMSVEETLKGLGFRPENGEYCGEIPELLRGSCCKSQDNPVNVD